MDVPDVLKAVAARIDAKKGDIGWQVVAYPPLNYVKPSPALMVRQSLIAPSVVEKGRAGQQVVRCGIDLVGLVAADPLEPAEASRLDHLIHPTLDLFDANANGGDVNWAFAGLLNESVDQIWNESLVRRLIIPWGESGECHAVIMTLDTVFKRKATMP